MFNKPKNLKPVPKIETMVAEKEESEQDRNSVLSDWNIPADGFTNQGFAQEQSGITGSTKKGYQICAKCLSVVPATDIKCASCGFIKK